VNYWRAIRARFTWRAVLTAQALAQAVVLVAAMEDQGRWGTWMGRPSLHNVAAGSTALVLLILAFAVEEYMARGASARRSYPLAIALALVCSWAMSYLCLVIFEAAFHAPPIPVLIRRFAVLSYGISFASAGSFAMLVYLNRRTAQWALERVTLAELRRVQTEREVVESRLAAAEAQIDPQELFDALAEIRADLARGAGSADLKLENLVQRLRQALAGTITVATTSVPQA
jgi:hypothetical protein